MALTRHRSDSVSVETAHHRCSLVRESLIRAGLFDTSTHRWRIAPHPFLLSPEQVATFRALGQDLLAFYRALNRLYQESVQGNEPAWVAAYLDQGKPESLVTFSRMKRFKNLVPAVIRPDIIPTEHGMVITELDSVPGGIGLTACMTQAYANLDPSSNQPSAIRHPLTDLVGGLDGMLQGFAAMLRAQQGESPGSVAIVVSDEAQDYRPEMRWLAAQLREIGLETYCVEPHQVHFTEEGLQLESEAGARPIGLVYRFFELFDLKNIPKSELIMYSAKKGRVVVTPPYKPALEEKSAFALFHHPLLRPFWERELEPSTLLNLTRLLPRTWILDPAPLPPTATLPDLLVGGRAVNDWRTVARASQKDRQYVAKPSGFSELAWGSRGVSVGHDLSQTEWTAALEHALRAFPTTPYILQEFHKGRLFELSYADPDTDTLQTMSGRTRLSPYYFVDGDKAELGGILATVCPSDKKLIHGMRDAIMAPCAIAPEASGASSEC